jgi:cytochrome c6
MMVAPCFQLVGCGQESVNMPGDEIDAGSHPPSEDFDPAPSQGQLRHMVYFLTLQTHKKTVHLAQCVPCMFHRGTVGPVNSSGEESMKTVFRAILVVMAVTLVFSTWTFAADASADVYKSKCASCHGPDGKGDTAMGKKLNLKDLASADVQKQSDADLTTVIEKGKKPMPGYEGKLTKEQITDLVKYIRALKK